MSESESTILIVDDSQLNVTLLDAILRPAGYRTLKALSGQEGRRLAQQHQPAMILLDITMPGEDGFTTCRILKSDPRTADIPVIFISALTGAESKVSGFSTGAVDYITKPEITQRFEKIKLSRFYNQDPVFHNQINAVIKSIAQPGEPELLSMYIDQIDHRRQLDHVQ